MTTALFALRCKQIGLTFDELDQLSYGFVIDMLTESANDGAEYNIEATSEDYAAF